MTQKECQKSNHISNPEYCNHFCSHCFLQVVLYFLFKSMFDCFTSVKAKNKFDVSYIRREGTKLIRKSKQFVLIFSYSQILTSWFWDRCKLYKQNKPYNKVLRKRPERDLRGTWDCQNLRQMKLDSLKQHLIGTDRQRL